MPTNHETMQGLRVLVVEDETLIAEEIRERLTRLGVVVVDVVDTGDRAVKAAELHQPQLILMDIRLKGPMDGIETADLVRRMVNAPVIFLTAHSDQETLRRAKGIEPFGYMLKPFHERDLIVAVEMALHRHGLELRLKESEHRYSATLASIGDAVIATDPEGRITFMNPVAEALTQWRMGEAKGLAVDRVFPVVAEATRSTLENPALRAMRMKHIVELSEPTLMIARNLDMLPIDDSAAPIADDKGGMLGAVVAFRDIRQRRLAEDALKRAEEQLRQSQKMEAVGRLAGGIAHDFNNLLTVINGYSEILLNGGSLDPTSRQLVGEVKKAGERAAGLTRQLLAFSRKQVLNPTEINLGTLVVDISRLLERLIGEDVILSVATDPNLWSIRADAGQVEQVIMNLAVNSRDAMPRGGRLTIETGNVELTEAVVQERPEIQPGRYALLTVSDTGCGMDRAVQEHVFEPFFTTKEQGKGTGLGLATVYGIVKQSGGFIFLYSELNKGTTFKIYFPAVLNATTTKKTGSTDSETSLMGREALLLVEDDASVRGLVSSALSRYGYTLYEADCGEEAVRCFAEHADEIRLVVTDVIMPGMSGREVDEKVHAIRSDVRVLYVSGYTDDAVVRHGVLQGDAEFLQKPFTMTSLARKVREVLDR